MKVFSKERLFKALRVGEIIRGIHVGEIRRGGNTKLWGMPAFTKKKEARRF